MIIFHIRSKRSLIPSLSLKANFPYLCTLDAGDVVKNFDTIIILTDTHRK